MYSQLTFSQSQVGYCLLSTLQDKKKRMREKVKACKATQSYENVSPLDMIFQWLGWVSFSWSCHYCERLFCALWHFLGNWSTASSLCFLYSPRGEALPHNWGRVYSSATQFVFLPSRFSFTQIDISQLTHEWLSITPCLPLKYLSVKTENHQMTDCCCFSFAINCCCCILFFGFLCFFSSIFNSRRKRFTK